MLITKAEAIKQLKNSEIVAIPTETVYGLAARFDDLKAVEAIFTTKERPHFDPLICHVSNLKMLDLL
ncbi:MAG: Sua5/YciO/YrdC/YwlC family protein, partial [Bdellovibrionales bacterium]|nr:Sua5/YciO/YrdC/YwlC family protein [Bdellovibrionales bacterium]